MHVFFSGAPGQQCCCRDRERNLEGRQAPEKGRDSAGMLLERFVRLLGRADLFRPLQLWNAKQKGWIDNSKFGQVLSQLVL